MIGRLAPAKPALQLLAGQLHDRCPAVNVVRGKRSLEQAKQQQPHLGLAQWLTSLDGCAASIACGESFEPVGPAAETSAGQVGDGLAKAGSSVEPRMW